MNSSVCLLSTIAAWVKYIVKCGLYIYLDNYIFIGSKSTPFCFTLEMTALIWHADSVRGKKKWKSCELSKAFDSAKGARLIRQYYKLDETKIPLHKWITGLNINDIPNTAQNLFKKTSKGFLQLEVLLLLAD